MNHNAEKPPEGLDLTPKTIKALRKRFDHLQSFTGSSDIFVNYLYKTADIIIKEQVEPNSVCSRGCSYCCKIPVEVTYLEASYIASKTGAKLNDLTKPKAHKPDNSPCTFLKDQECKIYKYRPLACRSFATMDSPDYCKAGGNIRHWVSTVNSSQPLNHLMGLLVSHSEVQGVALYSDIRHWFGAEIIGLKQL